MSAVVRIVIVEDSEEDAELAIIAIKRHGIRADVEVVASEPELRSILQARAPDIIISDNSMVRLDGKAVYSICCELAPDVPFIFLSGTLMRLAPSSAHADGATACVDKNQLEMLGGVVAEALQSVVRRITNDGE